MTDLIDVVIEDNRWLALELGILSEDAVAAAMQTVDLPTDVFEICIMGCSDARIAELNAEFREKPKATNVLSWPAFELAPTIEGGQPARPLQEGHDLSLGDIAIAFETCLREAIDKGVPVRDHVTHLIIHGCLHLLGYDHETDKDATVMEDLEVKALASMGVDNPY